MTVSPQIAPQVGISRRRQRLIAAELRENDLTPVCSHCHEYNAADAVWCAECGYHLTEQRNRIVKPSPWSTSA